MSLPRSLLTGRALGVAGRVLVQTRQVMGQRRDLLIGQGVAISTMARPPMRHVPGGIFTVAGGAAVLHGGELILGQRGKGRPGDDDQACQDAPDPGHRG